MEQLYDMSSCFLCLQRAEAFPLFYKCSLIDLNKKEKEGKNLSFIFVNVNCSMLFVC